MTRKRIIIDILVIAFAFILFTVWYQKCIKTTVPASSISLLKYYDVYLITTEEKDQFWQYVNNGAADMAAITGVNYIWKPMKEGTPEEQIRIINDAVDDGAKGLLVVADDPKRISGAIEDAKARGVKVVYVDSPANEEAITTLSTNNYKAGYTAGQKMLSYLSKAGINSGSIGIVNIESKVTTMQREQGFRDAIAAEPGFAVLKTVYTNGEPQKAQQAAEQMINQNKDLVGLFGTNEGTTEGVGSAIKENNNKIIGIGFDRSDMSMRLFNDGSLKAIIKQNPYTMGYLGMAEIVAALLGKDTGPSFLDTGYTVIEKDDGA